MKSLTLNGVRFVVSNDGTVSSPDFDNLGNIDDCEQLAGLIWQVFDAFNPDINI